MKRKLLFTIFAVLGLSSFVIAQDNLLANYQFDDIDDPIWDLNNNSGGDGVLVYDEFGELSGEYCASIEVNGTGDNNYNIQLVQYGIPVENGVTYYLSFMAKVEDVFNLAFSWEENGGSWTRYGTTSFILEPEITKYQYEFVSTGTDETANFKFFFGDQANVGLTVKLDSIVLSEDEFVYGEPTSVKQRSSNTDQLKVYPNPAKNDFTVS